MGGKPGGRQARGWMELVLILWLSGNVTMAGLVGGNALRYWQHGAASAKWRNEPGLDRRQTRILRMVPDARHEEARAILLARQDDYKAARESVREASQAAVASGSSWAVGHVLAFRQSATTPTGSEMGGLALATVTRFQVLASLFPTSMTIPTTV